MKRCFYITMHFFPDYEGTVFSHYRDDLYKNNATGEIFCKKIAFFFY